MAEKSGNGTTLLLVAGGIIAVFLVFLLLLVIPAHEYFMFILFGALGLVVVALVLLFPGNSRPARAEPAQEPWPLEKPDHIRTPDKKPEQPELPDGQKAVPLDPWIYQTGMLLVGCILVASLYFMVWQPYIRGEYIPPDILLVPLTFIVIFYRIYQGYHNLPPTTQEPRITPGYSLSFLKWLAGFFFRNFTRYIAGAFIFNGGLALVVLLAAEKTIDLDLTHANGFIVFLLFAFGNLLILALVLLHLERIGSQPVAGDGTVGPVTPGTPRQYLNPKARKVIMTILIFGFLAVFYAIPMLAFAFGFIGPETHEKEILIIVEHPDPSTVIVTYNGGRDAGTLVGLSAYEYVQIEKFYFQEGESEKNIASKSLGSKDSKIPLGINTSFTLTKSCPGKCTVRVLGYFSDGKYQKFYDAPL